MASIRAISPALALLLCLTAAAPTSAQAEAPTGPGQPAAGAVKDPLAGIKQHLVQEYPEVRHVSIATYLEQYPGATLIDVRAAEEYAVSRIPNAIHLADRPALLRFAQAHNNQTLILYCSVGARSADAAQYLQSQPEVGPVLNLAGSIFEWANTGRPLENDSGQTEEVHPYNAWWGWRYLQKRDIRTQRNPAATR